jgi:hypothetical protein
MEDFNSVYGFIPIMENVETKERLMCLKNIFKRPVRAEKGCPHFGLYLEKSLKNGAFGIDSHGTKRVGRYE